MTDAQAMDEVLRLTEESTNKPVLVQADASLRVHATLRMARGPAPAHVILFRPELEPEKPCLVSFECGFLLRLYQTPKEERFDFAGTPVGKAEAERLTREHLRRRKEKLPDAVVGQVRDQLYNGLMVQLRSVPIGLRVDEWIHRAYPALHGLQRSAAVRQLNENASVLNPELHEIAPHRVYSANVAMNAAFWSQVWADDLSENHDYVVIYARNKPKWTRRLLPRTEAQNARYSNSDNDPRGPWKPSDLSARNYYSKGTYPIECPGGRVIEGPPEGRYWGVSEDTLWDLDEDKRITWGEDGNNDPALKRFLSEVKDLVPETIWTYQEVGHTQDAKKEVLRILGGTETPLTPKPVDLIYRICWIGSEPGDIILDSFAGSGTTAHAILRLNAERKGDRNFVLVQQPYDNRDNETNQLNICEQITAPRTSRVIKGYEYVKRGPKGKRTKMKESGLGGTFTYARLGPKLFGEYRNFGDTLPSYEQLAKYIFYTETSREFDPKALSLGTGKIGEQSGTAYYILYSANATEDRPLDMAWLKQIDKTEESSKLVVSCE
jgi:hypothetical protein